MSNTVAKLLALQTEGKQANRTLREANAPITRDTAKAAIARVQSETADLLNGATDAEFAEYIAARNRH